MLYLVQLFKRIKDKEMFIEIFSYLKDTVEECGYENSPDELVEEMLMNHFDIEVEDEKQLKVLTTSMLKREDLSFLKNMA